MEKPGQKGGEKEIPNIALRTGLAAPLNGKTLRDKEEDFLCQFKPPMTLLDSGAKCGDLLV